MTEKQAKKAIEEHCASGECMYKQRANTCTNKKCPLYPYRMDKRAIKIIKSIDKIMKS